MKKNGNLIMSINAIIERKKEREKLTVSLFDNCMNPNNIAYIFMQKKAHTQKNVHNKYA